MKRIADNYNNKNLPSIKWFTEGIPEYQIQLRYIILLNDKLRDLFGQKNITRDEILQIEKFVNIGSRKGGKTVFWVRLHILLMVLDDRVSWITIMKTLKEGIKKVLREYEQAIDDLNVIWPGIKKEFRTSLSSADPWIRREGGLHKQEIQIISIKDASKAGTKPPVGCYYAGWWYEEAISADSQFSSDFDNEVQELQYLNALTETLDRFLPNEVYGLINVITCNPYSDIHPVIAPIMPFIKRNKKELIEKGHIRYLDEKVSTLYLMTGLKINHFLIDKRPNTIANMEKRYANMPAYRDMVISGIPIPPSDNLLSDIWDVVNEYQKNKIPYNGIKYTGVGVDVGGGKAWTTAILGGYYTDKHSRKILLAVDEWGYNTRSGIGKRPHEVISDLINTLIKWKKKYNFQKISVRVDGSATDWIAIFQSVIKEKKRSFFENSKTQLDLEWIKIIRLTTKWEKKHYSIEKRMRLFYNGLGTGLMRVYEKKTPMLYKQLQSISLQPNGKPKDGNDDFRNAFEYFDPWSIMSVVKQNFNKADAELMEIK